jgi:hypothetical protein
MALTGRVAELTGIVTGLVTTDDLRAARAAAGL